MSHTDVVSSPDPALSEQHGHCKWSPLSSCSLSSLFFPSLLDGLHPRDAGRKLIRLSRTSMPKEIYKIRLSWLSLAKSGRLFVLQKNRIKSHSSPCLALTCGDEPSSDAPLRCGSNWYVYFIFPVLIDSVVWTSWCIISPTSSWWPDWRVTQTWSHQVSNMCTFSYQSYLTSSINVCMTVPTLLFIDRWGRRPLLLWGGILMALWLFIVGGVMGAYGNPVPSIQGNANLTWQVTGPPSKAVIACTYLFVATFAPTWGPTAWVYVSEIFPLKYRAKANGLCAATNCMIHFVYSFWRQGLLTLRLRSSFLPRSRISNGRPTLSLAFSVWQCLFRCSSCSPRRVRNPSRKLIFYSRKTFHPGKQDLVPEWMSEPLPFDVGKRGERETRIPLCNKMRILRSLLSRGRVCEKLGVSRESEISVVIR